MANSILPEISIVSDLHSQIITKPIDVSLNKSFKFDWESGDLELSGGNITFVSEEENVRQWISKTLVTAMGYHIVYGPSYGNMVINWLGTSESTDLVEMLTPIIIKETLSLDNRILDVDRIVVTRTSDYISVSFRVMTINFDYFNEENLWTVV